MNNMIIVCLTLCICAINAAVYHSNINEMLPLEERSDMRHLGRASISRKHTVIFEMSLRNEDKLEDTLIDVSDPKSKNWGKHWTRDEIAAFFGPADGALESVQAFLHEQEDVSYTVSSYGEFVTATASVKVWEDVFSAEFMELDQFVASSDHADQAFVGNIVRTKKYTMPAALTGYVKAVHNTVQLPAHVYDKKKLKAGFDFLDEEGYPFDVARALAQDSSWNGAKGKVVPGYVTPQFLLDYYGVPEADWNATVHDGSNNVAVFESWHNYFSAQDLKKFVEDYTHLDPTSVVVNVHGNNTWNCTARPDECMEPDLDVQYLAAMAPGVPVEYFYLEHNDSVIDPFVNFVMEISDMSTSPAVASISYGESEQYVHPSTAWLFSNVVIKAGIGGTSVFVSSGDDGVADSTARADDMGAYVCAYMPSFPATCPYVTAVGATMGPEGNYSESACQSDAGAAITSGGGFSYIYDQPSWQKAHVDSYFASLESWQAPSPGYNREGRAIPDVSALGHAYLTVVGGKTVTVDGTSASAPVWAGLMTLINSVRKLNDVSRIGFLNLALYDSDRAKVERENGLTILRDITVGTNHATAHSIVSTRCQQGFHTMPGWDPVTGFGTMNFGDFELFFRDRETPSMSQEPTMAPTAGPTTGTGERRLLLDKADSNEGAWAGGHDIFNQFYAYAASAKTAKTTAIKNNSDYGPERRLVESAKNRHLRSDFVSAGRADVSVPHTVVLSLYGKNDDGLSDALQAVSDPESATYGRHWSREEIADKFGPRDGAIEAVTTYLLGEAGFNRNEVQVSPFGDCVTLTTTVGKLNSLFATEFYHYKVDGIRNAVVRTEQYSLPSQLEAHIKYALDTVHLPIPPPLSHRLSRRRVDGASADVIGGKDSEEEMILPGYTSPALIKELYNINTTAAQVKASIGTEAPAGDVGGNWGDEYQAVFATWGQVFEQSDIDAFNERFGLEDFNLSKVHLPANVSRNCQEDPMHPWMGCKTADLTVEYLSAIGQAIPTAFVYAPWNNTAEGESGYVDPFTQMITFFLNEQFTAISTGRQDDGGVGGGEGGKDTLGTTLPWVVSISYDVPEAHYSLSTVEMFNKGAAYMGLMGSSIIVNSGDHGAHNSRWHTHQSTCYKYGTGFPAASPYVTSVGASQGPEDKHPYVEMGASADAGGVATSGGGFSTLFDTPSWQMDSVNNYFKLLNDTEYGFMRPMPGYNRQGRGYPDLAFLSKDYLIHSDGKWAAESGSQAAAPAFAGMVSLVNAVRYGEGKGSLGFINPALYKYRDSYTQDMTRGDNRASSLLWRQDPITKKTEISGSIGEVCATGFRGLEGWDPVTGLGSIDYPKFLKHFKMFGNSTASNATGSGGWFPMVDSPAASRIIEPENAPTPIAASAGTHHAVGHDSRDDLVRGERADPSAQHTLHFHVAIRNADKLEQVLLDVSDPESQKYRQHWSTKTVNQYFGPKSGAITAVTNHLRGFVTTTTSVTGVTSQERLSRRDRLLGAQDGFRASWRGRVHSIEVVGETVTATARISDWEELLSTEFHEWWQFSPGGSDSQGENKGKKVLRALHYTIPEELREHVLVIRNTIQMPLPLTRNADLSADQGVPGNPVYDAKGEPVGYVTPATLMKRYNISDSLYSSSTSQGIFEVPSQVVCGDDLLKFQQRFNLTEIAVAGSYGSPNSGYGKKCGGEANLDAQYLMGVSRGAATYVYYGEDFTAALMPLVYQDDPPSVISISYGIGEEQYPSADRALFDTFAMKLGLAGVTVVVSSGDDGVAGHLARASGAYPKGLSACGYVPQWPASSPWITSVGGTQGPEYGIDEIVAQGDNGGVITSGGGFSNLYARPTWQESQVFQFMIQEDLFDRSKQPVPGYNTSGRAYPDVSAMARRFMIVVNGEWMPVYGTSASAPTFAAMVALINSAASDAGLSNVGFLNPALYKDHGKGLDLFHDVLTGENRCAAATRLHVNDKTKLVVSNRCAQGFSATVGWDPVTGLGSPKFDKMLAHFMSNLPDKEPEGEMGTLAYAGIAAFGLNVATLGASLIAQYAKNMEATGTPWNVTDDAATRM